jgi:hypothetical protein
MSSPEDVAEALFRIDRLTKLMAVTQAEKTDDEDFEVPSAEPTGGTGDDSPENKPDSISRSEMKGELTGVDSLKSGEFGCMRYGLRNGVFCFYREKLVKGDDLSLDILMCEQGGVIYEYYERKDNEPQLLCEDVFDVDDKLIKATINYFFDEIEGFQPETIKAAFPLSGKSDYCFQCRKESGEVGLIILGVEDFGVCKRNLLCHGCFDSTEDKLQELISLFNKEDHDSTPNEFSLKILDYLKGGAGATGEAGEAGAAGGDIQIDTSKFVSRKYGMKGGKYVFYNEEVLGNQTESLSFIVAKQGGIIYEDHEREPGELRLLCENIPNFSNEFKAKDLMSAAIAHFFKDLKDVYPAFSGMGSSEYCFKATDKSDLTVLVIFGTEGFRKGMNLMLLGKFQLIKDDNPDNDELEYIKTKLREFGGGLMKKSANNFALHAAEFARSSVGGRLEQVKTLIVSHQRVTGGGYNVKEETKLWPNTELTQVILETGGVVFDYKSCRDGSMIYCQYRYNKPYKLNMPKLMPAVIRTLYPGLTDVKPAYGVEDSLTQYCWSAKNRHGKTYLLTFGSICCYSTGLPVYDFLVRHLDIGDIPFKLIREKVDTKSVSHPETFADKIRDEAVFEILRRRKAARTSKP